MRKYAIIAVLAALSLCLGLLGEASAPKAPADVLVLNDSNTVVLSLPVFGEPVRDVQIDLLAKSAKNPSQPMYLFLDTPGGSVSDGLSLIDTAKGLPNPVHTVSKFSASMGFVIAQELGLRYILPSGALMQHRMSGGVSGDIPGSLNTRLNFFSNEPYNTDEHTAKRAGMDLGKFRELIRDELWLNAKKAVEMKFADRTVKVRCDPSLNGIRKTRLSILMFDVTLIFHKCPLVSEPVAVEISRFKIKGDEPKAKTTEDKKQEESTRELITARHLVDLMLNDKPAFYRQYIETGRYQEFTH